MNKVKPQVGQVWENTKQTELVDTIAFVDERGNVYWSEDWNEEDGVDCGVYSTPAQMNSFWEFIPQNDLEWLAVNVEAWEFEGCNLIVPDEYREFCAIDVDSKYCSKFQCYTHQQWQNMRYKLGLDEKPWISGSDWAEMLRDKK